MPPEQLNVDYALAISVGHANSSFAYAFHISARQTDRIPLLVFSTVRPPPSCAPSRTMKRARTASLALTAN